MELTSTPEHCCLGMDHALDEHYLEPTLQITASGINILNPHIEGPKLTDRGRKRKPSLIVNYCPWCGKQLALSNVTSEAVNKS